MKGRCRGALFHSMLRPVKIPQSVLVVIHTSDLDVLLIKRADTQPDGEDFWQSVTGSKDSLVEDFCDTAAREVQEETGIVCGPGSRLAEALVDWRLENIYDIYPRWLHRYAAGVARNTEHLFGLQVPRETAITLNPAEHSASKWLPWDQAARQCYSASNAEAILLLPRFIHP